MNAPEAKAEVFWTAFKALSKKEREAVVDRFLKDKEFLDDLMDVASIEIARHEPGDDLPLRDYMAQRNNRS